jgi:hypothetical protein
VNVLGIRLFLGLFLCVAVAQANASQMVFRGSNPAFFPDANPAAINQLTNSVNKPKPATPGLNSALTGTSALIQQAVQSQISSKINSKIFDQSPTNLAGSFDLGNGSSISYQRPTGIGGDLIITIVDPTRGGTTVISLPGF